jgi:hypothetical protein
MGSVGPRLIPLGEWVAPHPSLGEIVETEGNFGSIRHVFWSGACSATRSAVRALR